MTADLRIALTTSLNDRLVAPLKRSLGEVERTLDQSSQKLTGLSGRANALGNAAGPAKLKNELLGISQAADRAHASTKKLTDILPGLARGVGAAFAGIQAAKMVMATPLQRAADYELDLARASNIAYADRNTVKGRQAGQREMDASVRSATLQGVTRDDALLGLKTMIGAGTDRNDAMQLLPTLAKFSMAGEAKMSDVANIAIKAQQTFGIDPKQMPQALQMALNAGKLGQFEFKDMAHWLPEQMAISKNMLGMQGLGDLSTLLTANQFAAKSAGNNNGAGNNLVNFLGKINSTDTGNDAKKLGIDLTGSLVKARSEGTNPVDAFLGLMKKTAEKDPEYRKIQGRLQAAQESGDKKGEAATLGSMRDLMMGKSIGKLVQDRQALLGLLGILNDPEGFKKMRNDVRDSQGGVDVDQATLMATASMKNQQGENAMLNRQFDALQGFGGALGDAQVKLAELSTKYPDAAAGLEALKLGAYAAGAALMAVGAVNLISKLPIPSGGPKVIPPVPGAPRAGGSSIMNGPAAGAPGATGAAVSTFSRVASLAGAGMAAANPLMLIEALSGPSQEDIAKLYEMDRKKSGYRGKGFADPRMLGVGEGPEALNEKTAATQNSAIEAMTARLEQTLAELKAVAARPVLVTLDGQEIASSVGKKNGFEARRN